MSPRQPRQARLVVPLTRPLSAVVSLAGQAAPSLASCKQRTAGSPGRVAQGTVPTRLRALGAFVELARLCHPVVTWGRTLAFLPPPVVGVCVCARACARACVCAASGKEAALLWVIPVRAKPWPCPVKVNGPGSEERTTDLVRR